MASLVGASIEQATRTPSMPRVILKNLSVSDGFKNFIQCNPFVVHFLLSVLRDTNVLRFRLSLYPCKYYLHPVALYPVSSHYNAAIKGRFRQPVSSTLYIFGGKEILKPLL